MDLMTMVTRKVTPWRHSTSDDQSLLDDPQESLLVTAVAVAAGVLTRRALRLGWRQWRGEAPPLNPAAPGVSWTDALIWAASVGAAAGVARVISRRGATSALMHYRE